MSPKSTQSLDLCKTLTNFALPKRQKEVLLAAVDGLPHTMRNDVIAPLSQKALIRVVEHTPTGSAKKIEVTEWGQVVAKSLREDQQD